MVASIQGKDKRSEVVAFSSPPAEHQSTVLLPPVIASITPRPTCLDNIHLPPADQLVNTVSLGDTVSVYGTTWLTSFNEHVEGVFEGMLTSIPKSRHSRAHKARGWSVLLTSAKRFLLSRPGCHEPNVVLMLSASSLGLA